MPIGEIERFTRQFKGSAVFLSGGEPTVRSDLADIIKSVSRQVPVCGIVTNGLRLSDRTYLETLIDAGLQYVFFSLDSFRADHYEKLDEASIDGHRIIDRKLKALENLENLGVQTVLSSTIYPGVNDDEIAPLFSYSIKKSSFIIEMRFRACCRVGRWKPMEEIFNSQLIERFSHATGIEKDFIYQVDPSYDENTIHHVTIGLQGRMKGGRFVHLKAGRLWRGTKVQKIRSLFRSIIDGQLYSLLEYLVHRRNMVHMRVRFIHWPDVRSVDLSQVDRGVAQVLRDGRILNFCHAIILENRA